MLAIKLDIIEAAISTGQRKDAEPRTSVGTATTLRAADRLPLDVIVQDFSPSGFRFTLDRTFPVGTRIRIGLRGAGTEEARIVWSKGRSHGCAFVKQVSRERVAAAFRAQSAIAGRIAHKTDAPAVDDQYRRWPRAVRVGLLLSGTLLSWAGVFTMARAAIY